MHTNPFSKSPKFLAHTSAFTCPNDFKFGTETLCIIVKIIQKIDHNLHNHVFMTSFANHQLEMISKNTFESIAFLSKVNIAS